MLRVMLADDEQFERDYLEKVIRESYPTLLKVVCKAADGVEFMEKLEQCDPQIILLDVKMPRMDGLETAGKIREKYPDVQIIIVSAYGDFAYAKQAMKLGISEYLLKPYLESELREILDRVIVRIRDREDTLGMLSYSNQTAEWTSENILEISAKDFLWNMVFERKTTEGTAAVSALQAEGKNWLKVVVISCSALASMGSFSQEVMDNYFRLDGAEVWSSIWMDQMVVCLFSSQKEVFSEVNGCIRRARNYLAEEHQIPVACGVSGAYEGIQALPEAFREAGEFIREFSEPELGRRFSERAESLKLLCELEDRLVDTLARGNQEQSVEFFNEILEILERNLEYRDVDVKLNFGRSLCTIVHAINNIEGSSVCEEEIMKLFGMLEELNFNGDALRDHLEFFAGLAVKTTG